jgi:hypothetical protein
LGQAENGRFRPVFVLAFGLILQKILGTGFPTVEIFTPLPLNVIIPLPLPLALRLRPFLRSRFKWQVNRFEIGSNVGQVSVRVFGHALVNQIRWGVMQDLGQKILWRGKYKKSLLSMAILVSCRFESARCCKSCFFMAGSFRIFFCNYCNWYGKIFS